MCSIETELLHYAPGLCYSDRTNGFGLAPLHVGQNRLVLFTTKERSLKFFADPIKYVLVQSARFPY